jgi:hypothetical protein
MMGLLQRSDEGLAEVMDYGVKYAIRPNQLLHSWHSIGIGNLIQRSLCDIQS